MEIVRLKSLVKQITFLCVYMFHTVAFFLMTLQNIGGPDFAVRQIE